MNNITALFQVFDMLPVQMLSGYPYSIYDEDSDPCSGSQPRFFSRRKIFSDYFPYSGTANVYNVFKVRLFLERINCEATVSYPS